MPIYLPGGAVAFEVFFPKNYRRVAFCFAVALLAMASLGVLALASHAKQKETNTWVIKTDKVLLNLRGLRRVINEALVGERGYLITGDKGYLTEYELSVASMEGQLSSLEKLVSGNSSQVERSGALKTSFVATFAETNEIVKVMKSGTREKAFAKVREGRANSLADEVRKIISEMEEDEGRMLILRVAEADKSTTNSREILIIGFSFGLLVLLLSAWQVLRTMVAQRAAENELERFFASSSDMFCVADFNGYLRRLNGTFSEVLGYSVEELQAKPLLDFVHLEDRESTIKEMENLSAGIKSLQFENRYICKNGQFRWLSWKSTPITDEGVVYAVARDVTHRKALEQNYFEAKNAAQAASEAKSQFLANMSHEIRTPLNGILGMGRLVLDSSLNDEQRDQIQTLNRSGECLLMIINDILDFSKIEAGKLELEDLNFGIEEMMKDVEKIMAYSAHQKRLGFSVELDSRLPMWFKGDAGRLRQILVNLVGNAIKFTQAGQVVIYVRSESQNEDSSDLRFEVRDTGIGIPEVALQRMFKSFSQADATTTRRFGGTGLGLSISKSLVEMMHGKIGVESADGVGSTFWFTVCLPIGQKTKSMKSGEPIVTSFAARILVAEDNQVNQKIVIATLTKLGYRSHSVANGFEVLDALREIKYDLILMDCQMPNMDGYEATRIIRTNANLNCTDIPIIAMTANALKGDQDKCLEAGMNSYISKPFDVRSLHALIEEQLKSIPRVA